MVNFGNFQRLDPAARDVALELLDSAADRGQSFAAFMYRWMAFNAWMSAVTLKDKDWEMISALIAAPRLIAAHDGLMANDLKYGQMVDKFAKMWPVLNVRSVRAKLGYDAFRQYNKAELLAACVAANVRTAPADWASGRSPSWEELLRTIYQVRCNLFHGEKSPQSFRDRDLVFASDQILERFLAATGCFDWHDL